MLNELDFLALYLKWQLKNQNEIRVIWIDEEMPDEFFNDLIEKCGKN